ncbi:hypothetical protein QKT49_gp119 [Acanthamoeba castellanii medusavirus]|uniref:Uncharacterized protein n=1 Tax=Acanthamoeba castellanii medusavirus J1 TaxID=3114988 RepID=A0A3T1CWS1_9VIRU|nr:hypothetical protein QKT49_gp119 [Acanthamoeba castellanii medusavirus]BBI30259.1 hypothetical protein [Acanthamoeba castellanii medusavirus J1]
MDICDGDCFPKDECEDEWVELQAAVAGLEAEEEMLAIANKNKSAPTTGNTCLDNIARLCKNSDACVPCALKASLNIEALWFAPRSHHL